MTFRDDDEKERDVQSAPSDERLPERMGAPSEGEPSQDGPEPPMRWRPDAGPAPHTNAKPAVPSNDDVRIGVIGSTRVELSGSEITTFESARRLITVSQVTAIVSFIFGGVLLSALSIVCACLAYRKLGEIAAGKPANPEMQVAFKRVGIMAIGLAAFAFIANIVALVLLYPMAMEAMQSGDLGSLLSGDTGTRGGKGSVTWG